MFSVSKIIVQLGYKTQSEDTSIEAEFVQFLLWRRMTRAQKLAAFQRLAKRGPTLLIGSIRARFPNANPALIRQQYIRRKLGTEWAERLEKFDSGETLMIDDPLGLALKLASILNQLHIPYYVGGSVASSLQGEMRYTEDLDLVVNIKSEVSKPLIEAMAAEFYISEIALTEALRGQTSSFNVIHLETAEKADIFVMGSDEFSRTQMARRVLYIPDTDFNRAFYICSPEDTVLQKLIGFCLGGNQSQKQWRDILGVLKLQGESLDWDYLNQWAERLKLSQLLEPALQEAGLGTEL